LNGQSAFIISCPQSAFHICGYFHTQSQSITSNLSTLSFDCHQLSFRSHKVVIPILFIHICIPK